MSGEDNNARSIEGSSGGGGAANNHPQNREVGLDDLALASVLMPIARPNILDYLFHSGISLVPVPYFGGNDAYGVDDAARILASSLYDRRPVKQVVDDEAMCEIRDETFAHELAEKMKINTACGIWQEDFEEGEKIKILPCNHAFKDDAIVRWLKEEKAECPICRFPLKSKEISCCEVMSQPSQHHENDDRDEAHEDQSNDNNANVSPHHNDEFVRVNNIAMRLAESIGAGSNRLHQQSSSVYRESISVPINRLIETRRNLVSAARSYARGGGGGGGIRASMPLASGSAAAPHHHPSQPREAGALAVPHPEQPNDNINNPQARQVNYNIINNIYYYNNNLNNNDYNDDSDDNDDNDDNNDNNGDNNDNDNNGDNDNDDVRNMIRNRINNFNNYIYSNEYHALNQEEADIQEAIRRSLEEN